MFVFTTNVSADKNPIAILESNFDFLILQFDLGEYQIDHFNNFTVIEGAHFSYNYKEGAAKLPELSFIIGIPSKGNISFKTFDKKTSEIPLKNPILPYPKYVQEIGEETCRMIYEIQPEIYYNSLSPRDIVLTQPYIWRNQRVVKLIIHPFRAENNQLIITSEFRIRIDFGGSGHIKSEFKDKNFENVFRNKIINFDIAKNWSISQKREIPDNPFSNYRWFKIPITQDGIYKITKSQLVDFDIADEENLHAEYVRIFNGGGCSLDRNSYTGPSDLREIPVFLSQSGDDFSIYFYARDTNGNEMNPNYNGGGYNQHFNPYTGENIYWLTYITDLGVTVNNPSLHKTILQRRNPKETLNIYHYKEHFEEEELRLEPNGIKWFWYNFPGTGSNIKSFEFFVSNLVQNGNQKIMLKFNSRPDNTLSKFYLNNNEIHPYILSSSVWFSGDLFKNGNNRLDIQAYSSGSQTLSFNFYEVEYDKNLSLENNRVSFSLPEINTLYNIEIRNVRNSELQIFKVYDFDNVERIDSLYFENNKVYFTDSINNKDIKYFAVCQDGYISPSQIIEKYVPKVYYSYNENGQIIEENDKECYLRNNIKLANTDLIIICPEEYYEKSKELANFHSEIDSMTVLVTKLNDVYDEFSWGLPDVVAIRYFLHYAFDYYGVDSGHKVSYVILVGDGTNDFRNYDSITGDKNKILPFIKGTTPLDENYVCFNSSNPEMMIGRIPCQTITELEIVIDKIINYTTNPNYGFWRSRVMISADDVLQHGDNDQPQHTNTAECSLAVFIDDNVELIKIYGIDYPLDELSNKPEANEAIIKTINNGVAIFVYIGHGGYDVLGDEDYFRSSDISKLNNSDMLPFFYAGSCNVGHFDSNTFESMAEKMLLAKDRGAIASYASSRSGGYGPYGIVSKLVNEADRERRIGEIISTYSSSTYNLFGDPALRLVIPPSAGDITIADNYPDSLKARQTATLIGNITDADNRYEQIFAVVYDTDYQTTYYYVEPDGDQKYIDYYKKGKPIFKGPISCSQDTFSLRFIVPDDIYGSSKGHILAYAVNTDKTKDILMSYHKQSSPNNHNLIINGYSDAVNDGPPSINIWLDREEFKNGDYVSATPTLFANISDSNGINITNYPGHRILLTIDDYCEENITDYFIYNTDSYTDGTIEYKINNLSVGSHQLKLELFDNFNEGAGEEISFKIKETAKIKVRNVLNYPNPMKDFTYFTFYLDGDAVVDIEVFTISGKKIKTISDKICQPEYNQIFWDGKDNDGDSPASGVYFYKIILNSKRVNNVYKLIISH
ncbi:MAG: type IX secretion system sortase PorU [Candidatus Cloacimonadota bacterium]|nr:type IX secretion system sortase PorU [Candidatus Cloacimonadota bacterium]